MPSSEPPPHGALRVGRRRFVRIAGGAGLAVAAGAGWLARRGGPPPAGGPTSVPASASPPFSTTTINATTTITAADQPSGHEASPPSEPASDSQPAAGADSTREPPQPVLPAGAATQGVIAVGEAYLRERPHEADTSLLLAALDAPDGDFVVAARRSLASDFAEGRTVELDGWVLSVSEARAAAVVALACSEGC